MQSTYHIGIVGCGIGGLAVACALADQGHQLTLFDRFQTPQPVGSGLVIQPVGQDCLAKIGVMDAAVRVGRPIYQLRGTESTSKRTVLHAEYGPVDHGQFGLAIHRSDLFDCLNDAASKRGVTIVGSTVIASTHLEAGGRGVRSTKGVTHGPFDLLIDASGAGSNLSPIRTRSLPYGALWGTVHWPEQTVLRRDCLTQCYQDAHHMIGVLPLNDDGRTAIFWSEPEEELSAWFDGDLAAWKTRTVDLWPEFSPFVEQISTHDQMSAARYRHGTLNKPYAEKLVFIGDSAHQASPQLGQGANMALLDAMALAESVQSQPLDRALKHYARRRRLHVQFYQAVSDVFTPFYQSSNPLYPFLRNNLLHPVSQVWPANRALTALVSGSLVKTGA